MPDAQFNELFLDPRLLRAIGKLGFEKLTPIQAEVIPQALQRLDIIATAPTGSGKTVAYLLPVMQGLLEQHAKKGWPKALVLVPTRELAIQVRRVFNDLSDFCALKASVLSGGVKDALQEKWLQDRPELVVATPGRLLDLLQNGKLAPVYVDYLVLDEADRMLDMGFIPAVAEIIAMLPVERQSLLFSATMENPQVVDFAETIMQEPMRIGAGTPRQIPANIEQLAYFCDSPAHKWDVLLELLAGLRSGQEHKADDPEDGKVLVFTNTRTAAESLAERLHAAGIASGVLHGELSPKERNQRVRHFKGGRLSVLVATDIAARGIHIDEIDIVINHDMSRNAETYLHRAGRTGRLSASGRVISLVLDYEAKTLQRVERFTRQAVKRLQLEGLQPKTSEPQFKRRKSKDKPREKTAPKARVKKRLRDRKNKGKPKLPLGRANRQKIKQEKSDK